MPIKNLKILSTCFIVLGISMLISGCTNNPFTTSSSQLLIEPAKGLEIYIFDSLNHDDYGELGIEKYNAVIYNDLSPVTQENLTNASMVITDDDIISYDWEQQKIILKRIETEQTDDVFFIPPFSAFIVSFQGRLLFGGVVSPELSADDNHYHVMYVTSLSMTPDVDSVLIRFQPDSSIPPENGQASLFPVRDSTITNRLQQYLTAEGKLTNTGNKNGRSLEENGR